MDRTVSGILRWRRRAGAKPAFRTPTCSTATGGGRQDPAGSKRQRYPQERRPENRAKTPPTQMAGHGPRREHKTPTRPLISKPKRIYTAASRRSCQDANNTSKRTFILLFHTFSGRCSAAGQGGIFAAGRGRQVCFAQPHPRCLITSSERVSSWA